MNKPILSNLAAVLLLSVLSHGLSAENVQEEKAEKTVPVEEAVRNSFTRIPTKTVFVMEWKEIAGAANDSCWHIQGTTEWVRVFTLGENYRIESKDSKILDPKIKYEVEGVLLQNDYGCVTAWAYSIKPLK